jgi:trimeric autotransporter adhesin
MKQFIILLPTLLLSILLPAQNVGIGISLPDASALLELSSSSKGLLIPRVNLVSKTDVTTVPSPATGLLVLNTNDNTGQMPDGAGFYVWTGTTWVKLLLNEDGNATSGWTTRGNTGTNVDSNFVGTTDNVPLTFKINNGLAGKININGSLAFGRGALKNSSLSKINTAFGDSALYQNGIGAVFISNATENTAVGTKSAFSNTTGANNTAIGHYSLLSNTTGSGNTAMGRLSLFSNTTGIDNTAVGNISLFSNTTGRYNVACGPGALYANTTGYSNVAIGVNALSKSATRYNIVAIGDSALLNNGTGAVFASEGVENTAVGSKSMYSNTLGTDNTAMGHVSLYSNTTGFGNTTAGRASLFSNTTGSFNTAMGLNALQNNTTGSNNAAYGPGALYANTTGYSNVAIGVNALSKSATRYNIVAIGDSALLNNGTGAVSATQGAENTAVGSKSLYSVNTGSQNTAAGFRAGYSTNNNFGTYIGYQAGLNTNGVSNTYIGWGAGTDAGVATITTGGDNVCIGVRAGQAITTGNQNIAIGNLANVNTGSLANTITIGHNITNTQSNSVVLGNGSITKWGFGVNTGAANILEFNNAVTTARLTAGGVWTNASDKSLKTNFTPLNGADMLNRIMQLPLARWSYIKENNNITHIGPMAQDFYRLFKTGGDDKTISSIDPAGVALVGVQALKREIEELRQEVKELKTIIKKGR